LCQAIGKIAALFQSTYRADSGTEQAATAVVRFDSKDFNQRHSVVRTDVNTAATVAFAEAHPQTTGSVHNQIITAANSSFAVSHCSHGSMKYSLQ
jgi:hypothetical protein